MLKVYPHSTQSTRLSFIPNNQHISLLVAMILFRQARCTTPNFLSGTCLLSTKDCVVQLKAVAALFIAMVSYLDLDDALGHQAQFGWSAIVTSAPTPPIQALQQKRSHFRAGIHVFSTSCPIPLLLSSLHDLPTVVQFQMTCSNGCKHALRTGWARNNSRMPF